MTAHEIRDRVRARFPALPPLPDRPRLDQLLADAGLGLVYDDAERGYRWPTRAADTKGLASRQATVTVPPGPQLVSGGRSGHRLAESASTRSFLALGVDADRADRAVRALAGRLGAAVLDVTGVLVETMRAQAAEVGLPWDLVQAADAAPAGSRDAAGLAALVQRSLPAVEDAITAALAGAPDGTRPVVLTEIAPLARYGHLAMLSRWTDLAARRPQAIWVIVPQLPGSIGAIIDKRPLPLAAPGQFFRLDAEWIDARPDTDRRTTVTATTALTAALQQQVLLLEDDLRARVAADPEVEGHWKQEYQRAFEKERTAASWVAWRDDRVTQAAVAWVLTTVFIRFCEDNALVGPVWIAGPAGSAGRRRWTPSSRSSAPTPRTPTASGSHSAIDHLAALPATRALVDSHSALRLVSPSGNAVTRLLDFWRDRTEDGTLVHDLRDPSLSTRFLGDLYQDLSQHAKDTYALLQTPVFVEEFILDRTLEPALKERPLEGFRLIDPTCGSGHFLLGAFDRLLDRWHKHAPGLELQARVQAALDAIHGVDLNPFAVAIARFRLTVAALQASGLSSLEAAPAFTFHLAVGDSLIHGPDPDVLPGMSDRTAYMSFTYATEDGPLLLEILEEGRYDVVVGNPPYITAKDKALNQIYRSKYANVCKGTYALTVPFMALFFALAKRRRASRLGRSDHQQLIHEARVRR